MLTKSTNKFVADYDVVGDYKQDRINGFQPDLIHKMVACAEIENGQLILDAMAGNGNLTAQILGYCKSNNIEKIKITTLEFSEYQCQIAKRNIKNQNVSIFWGDILTLESFETGDKLPIESFDRILLKSANHEIPAHQQATFYNNLFSLLKPGGKLIMLGFVFDNEEERNEFAILTKFKDTTAGMTYAAENRHFSTRKEISQHIEEAGFENHFTEERFEYTIHSDVVVDEYFKHLDKRYANIELQSHQAKALTLRKHGRIRFQGDQSVMSLPGEITVAKKASFEDHNLSTFKKFPVDILGKVRTHMQMLQIAANFIHDENSVLDIGCGSGLLTNLVLNKNIHYLGLDVSNEFIDLCKMRYSWFNQFKFQVADIHQYPIQSNTYDIVTIMNTLYLPGMKPVDILRNIYQGLKPKGKVIISGPTSINSLRLAEETVFKQLKADGFSECQNDVFEILKYATENLMTEHANYYSAEGMAELLLQIGFTKIIEMDTTIYYGNAYLVCAEK